jgi:acylphosphatase
VGFRYTAYDEARRLHLSGWVRNTFEGDVEIFAEGPQDRLDAYLRWLKRGPSMARVDSVDAESRPPEGLRDFSIKH